jgi:hypothetical protein
MSSMMAGVATGGITTLATGSLSRGLMAGLGAYGGAGLGESLMNAGSAGMASTAGATAGAEAAQQGLSEAARSQAIDEAVRAQGFNEAMGKTAASDVFGAGAKAAAANPMAFAKQNLGNLAYAAAPIAAGLMVPTTTKLPDAKDNSYIRQFDYNINPETGRPDPLYGMRAMTPIKASEFGNKTFQGQRDLFRQQNPNPYELGVGSLNQPPQQSQQQQQTTPMATGGIVALAEGGDVQHFALGDLVKADLEKAYAANDVNKINEIARANMVTAADVADTYKGFDTSGIKGLQLYTPPSFGGSVAAMNADIAAGGDGTGNKTPAYTQYSDEQMRSFLSNPVNKDIDLGKAIKDTNADPAAVNRYIASIADPFRGSTDTTGGSGVLGIYNRMVAEGIDPTELYKGELANDPKYAGYTQPMIQKAYDLSKGAYALSAAEKDGVSDKEWVNFMDTNGYSIDDMAQAFGLSRNEVKARYDAAKKVDKIVTTGTGTGGTGTSVTPGGTLMPGGFVYDNGAISNYGNNTGNPLTRTPGDLINNPNGTVTVVPNIPGRPYGGFPGMDAVKNSYTAGGGSLGYTAPIPKDPATYYNKMTEDSLDAYNFLMGKGKNLTQRKAETRDRPVSQRYDEAVLGRKIGRPVRTTATTKSVTGVPGNPKSYFNEAEYLAANPDVAAELKTGKSVSGEPTRFTSGYEHYLMYGKSGGRAFTGDYEGYLTAAALANAAGAGGGGDGGGGGGGGGTGPGGVGGAGGPGSTTAANPADMGAVAAPAGDDGDDLASGGMAGYAMGGGLGSLGSYSDGGRLLRGPGDGVSDSIPATIGRKNQPARLADGEFVIPARIVSELGNGSTDAGAKKLYAMMDRVQRARGKTTGKNKVAANSRSDKYLPA